MGQIPNSMILNTPHNPSSLDHLERDCFHKIRQIHKRSGILRCQYTFVENHGDVGRCAAKEILRVCCRSDGGSALDVSNYFSDSIAIESVDAVTTVSIDHRDTE
mmetsp:Transcript_6985/g.12542  ORF Transcript_6985/g.12542 Transcript_6985/m.12542 type:complete len:104 (-) Transcript_6985:16-327(-)